MSLRIGRARRHPRRSGMSRRARGLTFTRQRRTIVLSLPWPVARSSRDHEPRPGHTVMRTFPLVRPFRGSGWPRRSRSTCGSGGDRCGPPRLERLRAGRPDQPSSAGPGRPIHRLTVGARGPCSVSGRRQHPLSEPVPAWSRPGSGSRDVDHQVVLPPGLGEASRVVDFALRR
jgi:hypothetical protein